MCIALFSTAHPDYPLIILDNRDEFLRRPTDRADWWPTPHSNVLAGRDLARPTHGTWMGVTREGKVAVLTNYREQSSDKATGRLSRGMIVNEWLIGEPDSPRSTRDFVERMVASDEARSVGGFSLVCGYVDEPLALVSNRSATMDHVSWVASERNQTLGLSNTTFDDRSWPKILDGERLMGEAIAAHKQSGEGEDALIDRLLGVLNYLPYFRRSIFVPRIGARDTVPASAPALQDGLDTSFLHGPYGTQKQTVILVGADRRVRYFERTLFDGDTNPIPAGQGDRSFEFVATRE
ncbi:DUF833-domain-containing protein [Aspergillus campestris IBT 28561]|uniref:DUF833-domain-containing protein n=1 Tax=Aspergillus campestris (strain IBT 28561) TaxID=1392248 RepID=A0A2I1CQG0_ASPC2|nr:DUF833-domain-containing protein [Aspergillus campestris IBT 28561]PKX99862.1 DUF833-domain-containing protein [Aspergillus campestris IBT 28561]